MINFYKSKTYLNDFENEYGAVQESELIFDEDILYFSLYKIQNGSGPSHLRITSREGRQRGLKWSKTFVPADGMEEFKRSLKELIEEYGENSSAGQGVGTRTN